jgi:uroporphyrinogen-III decarboxylase
MISDTGTITGMDRLVAALNGAPSDRIPVFCNLLDQGAGELGVSMRQYYESGELVAEAQLKMRQKYGYDNVWSLFYVGKEAQLLGCQELLYSENGPPNVKDFVIKTAEDIHRLQVPEDILSHPGFAETVKCLTILKDEVGGKYPICAYLTSSMTLPALLMGMEQWLQLLLLGPADLRDELLWKCSEFFQREIAAYRAAGADVLVYANAFGSTDFFSLKQFQELTLPWMERDLAPGGTAGVVYYCGSARFNRVIDQVIERIGIGTYYLSPLDDIAQGKRIIDGRGLTCGTINDIRLIDWNEGEVKDEVRRLIAAGAPGGRFLFGTIVMPVGIPEPNIHAMLDAAFEYGRCGGEFA